MNKNTRAMIAANKQQGVHNYNSKQPPYNGNSQMNTSNKGGKNFTVNNAPSVDYFTIIVTNNQATATPFVLFDILRPLWVFNTGEFLPLVPAQTVTIDPTTGNIVYTNATPLTVVLNCQELPIYSLFYSTIQKPFQTTGFRMGCLTSAQQANQWSMYSDRDFLGTLHREKLNAKASLSPLQFQALTLDIAINQEVNAETALVSIINTTEVLQLVWAVSGYNTDNQSAQAPSSPIN